MFQSAGRLVLVTALTLSLTACDGIDGNRYELGKDATGNTVRLDRKTGEVAIIAGDQIRTLKDAAQADAERKTRLASLERAKNWGTRDLPQIGAQAWLSTSWRDGKLYFSLSVGDLASEKLSDEWWAKPEKERGPYPKIDPKAREAGLAKAMKHAPLTFHLLDANSFQLASVSVGAYAGVALTKVVDESGSAIKHEAKGAVPMGEEDYVRVSAWTIQWR